MGVARSQGGEPALPGGAEPHALLDEWPVPHALKHGAAIDHQFHRHIELARRRRRQGAMGPGPRACLRTRNRGTWNNAHVFLRDAQHLGKDIACIHHGLGGVIQGEAATVP